MSSEGAETGAETYFVHNVPQSNAQNFHFFRKGRPIGLLLWPLAMTMAWGKCEINPIIWFRARLECWNKQNFPGKISLGGLIFGLSRKHFLSLLHELSWTILILRFPTADIPWKYQKGITGVRGESRYRHEMENEGLFYYFRTTLRGKYGTNACRGTL